MKKGMKFLVLAMILVLGLAACSDGGAANADGGQSSNNNSGAPKEVLEAQEVFGMNLPTENVESPTFVAEALNMQVKADFDTMVEFTTNSATAAGYTEYELLTSITDGVSSMVFNGHANGRSIVIQMVDLGNGNININMRFEDL